MILNNKKIFVKMTCFNNCILLCVFYFCASMGILWPILLFIDPPYIDTNCIIKSKNFSLYSADCSSIVDYRSRRCGSTLNYKIQYQVYLSSYNYTTIICGSNKVQTLCCCKEGCRTVNNNFYESCPPVIESSLLNISSVNDTRQCWLNSEGKVFLLNKDIPYVVMIISLSFFGL